MGTIMQQISFYEARSGLLEKTTCQVIEKCYYNNLKVVVVTPDIERQELFNKLLWTYSQKHFIPHGSKFDPLPEKQMVYLTTEAKENPNNATVLLLINATDPGTLARHALNSSFDRIIFIYDYLDGEQQVINRISATINFLKTSGIPIDLFKQNLKGGWVKE